MQTEPFHPLDRLIGDHSFSMLEALVPFVDFPMKRMLVLFIKYKELTAILQSLNDRSRLAQYGFDCHPGSQEDFFCDLCKILPQQQADNMRQMAQMLRMVQMMDMTKDTAMPESESTRPKNDTPPDLYASVMNILNE